MKTWQYLRLIALIGLFGLTTCKQKETGPSIDEVVGQYDATLEFTGGLEWNEHPIKGCSVTKSVTEKNMIEIQLVVDDLLTETWKVKYGTGGNLVMDKQDVYVKPTNYGYTNRIAQEATGKVAGDSITLYGIRFYSPHLSPTTYCKLRAKKKR